jgi:hypothetical protein
MGTIEVLAAIDDAEVARLEQVRVLLTENAALYQDTQEDWL